MFKTPSQSYFVMAVWRDYLRCPSKREDHCFSCILSCKAWIPPDWRQFFPQALGTQCGSWCGRPPGTWASLGSLGLWQVPDRYLQANHILSEALDLRLHLLPWHHPAPVQATCSRKCRGKLVPPWGLKVKRVPTWGPEWEGSPKGRVCICVWLTLCSTAETDTTLESN